MPCVKISGTMKMNLEISGENPPPAADKWRVLSRFRLAGSRTNHREIIFSNGSRADVFWPLTGQAGGKHLCLHRSELGHISSSDRPYLIPINCGRICGAMKMNLKKPVANPLPAAVILPVFSGFRLDESRTDSREINFRNGSSADDGCLFTGRVDGKHLRIKNLKLGVNRPAFAPYFIPDCCSRISGAMKMNLHPPFGNPPPVTFTGPGFRPELSANDGERRKISATQLLIDSVLAGVTRE